MNHCQICEGGFTSNKKYMAKPVMSLHGFKRPGHGWLEGSCFGAKYYPVEISNDRMQPYIEMVTNYRNGRASYITSMQENPPATMTWSPFIGSKEVKTLERPVDFDSSKKSYASYGTYEGEFSSRISAAEWDIKKADREIERMQKRLDEWKPV